MQASVPLCTHLKLDGVRCGSPALRLRPYCYYHNRVYTGQAVRHDIPERELPPLINRRNLAIATSTVLRYWHSGRYNRAEATAMLDAIRLTRDLIESEKRKGDKKKARG